MSLLSTLGGIAEGIGSVLTGGIAPAIIGGAASLFGQSSANKTNVNLQNQANAFSAEQAQKQMDFQADMSNTAYQRSMEDMKKAGLNPMLAFSQGGASTPGGAMGSVQSGHVESALAKGVSSAIDTQRLSKEIAQANSQIDLNDATASAAKAQKNLSDNNAEVAKKNAQVIDAQMPSIIAQAKLDKKSAEFAQRDDVFAYDNLTKRVSSGLGAANSAKDLLNPLKFGSGLIDRSKFDHLGNRMGPRP